MKILIVVIIFFGFIYSHADEKLFSYKNWKTFKSDYGYEFKYPDCWMVAGDGPDEPKIANSSSKNIAAVESEACLRPRMDQETPNGISFTAGWDPPITKEEALKKLELSELNANNAIKRNDWKIFKRLKITGDGETTILVENHQNTSQDWIRWDMRLYCPTQYIHIVGPSIKNPDKSFDKKFKNGDLALPEPEKTIYESIKCIELKKTSTKETKK